MKTIKLTNLREAIMKGIKLITFKKILGGAWLGKSLGISTPKSQMRRTITLSQRSNRPS